jgi:two-component system chemotaxis sensor kinase CheA
MQMTNEEFLERLRAAFRQEAEEHVEAMASGLIALESGGGEAEELEKVYRAAHSLKGAARAVGLTAVETLCQALEAVYRVWRQGKLVVAPDSFDLLHQGLDALQVLLADGDEASHDVDSLRARLTRLAEGSPPPATASLAKPPVPTEVVPEADPGASAAVAPPPITEPTPQITEPTPQTTEPTPQVTDPTPPVTEPTPQTAEPTPQITEATPFPHPERRQGERNATVRVPVDRLDDLLRQVEATLAAKLNAEHLQSDLRALRVEFAGYRKTYERSVRGEILDILGRDTAEGIAVRESFDRHDEETRRLERHIRALGGTALSHAKTLGRMVDTLMQDTKRVAMQPFSALMNPFPRMVRDIARKEGKEVTFQVLGDSVEIEKRILDDLKDPMTHLLRNCIDHGLEKPEARERAGKPQRGSIRVEVSQVDSGKVEVLIIDDGDGIRPDRVAKAAVARGHLAPEQADGITAEQAAELIFMSGLSSAPIVTDLSGHGLGLAIVRQKVEELGGTINVTSTAGEGATFRILLPLTTATFRGVVIEVEERQLVMPASAIERVIRVAQSEVQTVENQETLRVDGKVVPLVRLEEVLELPRTSLPGVHQEYLQVVVVRAGVDQVGFAVDRVVREQEVLVKGLGSQLVRVRNIAGATVLGSGQVVPILNVSDLVASARGRTQGRRRAMAETGREKRARICVAEDSITSRMLLKNILESAGYDVVTAVDGAEAFSYLKTEPFDILVSDVEMPRMNGLELTEKVRREARLEGLPVILVTALESREDRERGIDAGANAYIVKSSFDQGNLLETLRRFL